MLNKLSALVLRFELHGYVMWITSSFTFVEEQVEVMGLFGQVEAQRVVFPLWTYDVVMSIKECLLQETKEVCEILTPARCCQFSS